MRRLLLQLTSSAPEIFQILTEIKEIRRQIYEELLITSCSHPGVSKHFQDLVKDDRDEIPSVQILLVSKAVRNEANPILYSRNTYNAVALGETEWHHVQDSFLEAHFSHDMTPTREQMLLMVPHDGIVKDVGKIFDPDAQSLPPWLFQLYSVAFTLDGSCDIGLGCQFPAFLRQIGPTNTAMIVRVELFFGTLPDASLYFYIYSEILRQHFPRLGTLLISKLRFSEKCPKSIRLMMTLIARLQSL